MGLIAAWKRLWEAGKAAGPARRPSVASLLREERSLLEEAIGTSAYTLREEGANLCHVAAGAFTLTFTWDFRDQWATAAIRLHGTPCLPFDLDCDPGYEARHWLRAVGVRPASPPRGALSAALIRAEIEIVGQAFAHVFRDERRVREAAFCLDGYGRGYTDCVLVAEELPPDPVLAWTEEALRRRGRPVRMPRAGQGR